MLLRLEIRDFAVISNMVFEPGYGLNVISGETGAGKSLIVGAIGLILGNKSTRNVIRTGHPSCYVEACFDCSDVEDADFKTCLEEHSITPDDGMLIISRTIYENGKSVARINGEGVTLTALKAVTSFLVDIHGQHDTQKIFDEKQHVKLLDRYAGKKVESLFAEYTELLNRYKDIVTRIRGISSSPDYLDKRREYLEFVVNEITEANFKSGDEERLTETRKKLIAAEETAADINEAASILSDEGMTRSTVSSVQEASRALEKAASTNKAYRELADRANSLYLDLDALASDLSAMLDKMNYEPELKIQTEERLGLLFDLKAKYGSTVDEINEFCDKSREELASIEGNKDLLKELKEKRKAVEAELVACAEKLSEERAKAGRKLSAEIISELADLEMPDAVFEVSFTRHDKAKYFSSTGIDDVAFKFSANPGQEVRPLSAIVSGGEASRIMLAIKNILGKCDSTQTLIFDEIDSGVSGKAAGAIASKLRSISSGRQVLCVTHTAQVAAAADCNFKLSKTVSSGNTETSCELLGIDGKTDEVSRLLSGSSAENSVRLARELIDNYFG